MSVMEFIIYLIILFEGLWLSTVLELDNGFAKRIISFGSVGLKKQEDEFGSGIHLLNKGSNVVWEFNRLIKYLLNELTIWVGFVKMIFLTMIGGFFISFFVNYIFYITLSIFCAGNTFLKSSS